jgi:acetyltransferase
LETEIDADVAIRLAPVDAIDAMEMLNELSAAARYRGFRGAPVIDETELAGIIQVLGLLILTRADIAEIEINPLRVTQAGLVALDALVIGR